MSRPTPLRRKKNVSLSIDNRVELRVYQNSLLVFSTPIDRPLDVGRQRLPERPTLKRYKGDTADRIVVATIDQHRISRSHLLIEPIDDLTVRITNTSQARFVALENDLELYPGAQIVTGDVCLKLDDVQIHICIPAWREAGFYRVTASEHTTRLHPEHETMPVLVHHARRLGRFLDNQGTMNLLDCISGLSQFVDALNTDKASLSSLLEILSRVAALDYVGIYECGSAPNQVQILASRGSARSRDWLAGDFGRRLRQQGGTLVENPDAQNLGPARIARVLSSQNPSCERILYAERGTEDSARICPLEAFLIDLMANLIGNQITEKPGSQADPKNFRDTVSGFLDRIGFSSRPRPKPPSSQ